MKFEQVLRQLQAYRTPGGDQVTFLLAQDTMRAIYDCVLHGGATACLELGTGHGATTCVIAAALDERGGGHVTTVDMLVREPIDVEALAQYTGLSRYIERVADPAGYNWYLREMVSRQTAGNICAPCFDFCFLDGAHEWGPDALATFLVAKLLRPGAWLVLDDLDFKLRECQPGWRSVFADRSDRELDAYQLDWVFNLVLRQHPDFGDFTVSDGGRTGWARKQSGDAASWHPAGRVLDPVAWDWKETFVATDIARELEVPDGMIVTPSVADVSLQAARTDPTFVLPDSVGKDRPIDVVTLRLCLLTPATEILQLFWVNALGDPFNERQSVRTKIEAADHWHEVTIRINGSNRQRPIHAIRLDPTDGPSTLRLESIAIGGWHRAAQSSE